LLRVKVETSGIIPELVVHRKGNAPNNQTSLLKIFERIPRLLILDQIFEDMDSLHRCNIDRQHVLGVIA